MSKKNIIIIYSVIIVILLLIIVNLLLRQTNIIGKETKILQKMDETEQVSSLQTQIDNLNVEHEGYMNYIQTCKSTIATAITNQGVSTSADDTFDVMAENIGEILNANQPEGTWRLGLTIQIGYQSSGYARTTFSPICEVTLKDGDLTISYVNENYQTVNIIGKSISVDPCAPMTITKIK